jgi:hypothetical protein
LGGQLYLLGARAGNTVALKTAYAALAADATKAPIVEALKRGEDPQVGGDICVPTYGCGATIAQKPARRLADPASTVAGALTLLAGLLVMRRRRR